MAAFIATRWTTREVVLFFEMLAEFERTVVRSHIGYSRSESFPGCHRAIIPRNASVIFEIRGGVVRVLAVVDNRSARPRS